MFSSTRRRVAGSTPRTIAPDALLGEALRRMTAETPKISAIFVVENGRPVGIVHLHDCLRVGLV